jgi:two-component system chemotaxis response regulator CheB
MIKVVCVDDSAFLRVALKEKLEASGEIQVVASLKDGREAVEWAKTQKTDLMILDCEMPVMNGLEALRRIMKDSPLPVLMFSSLTDEGAAVTIKALEYGAVDFLLKPTSQFAGFDEVIEDLINKIKLIVNKKRFIAPAGIKEKPKNIELLAKRIDLIAMGSSTGGVQATMQVVPKLPANSPPVVWVQHMPEHFTKSFSQRLDGISQMRVSEARDGEVVERGHVYMARGGVQMQVAREGVRLKLRVAGTDKVSGFAPSCDVLFSSVSEHYGANALGVILTGMGADGTKGLVKMHAKGSYVVGQDEKTCVVYGMPRAAYEAGAVDVQLPIEQISSGVAKLCGLTII